MQPFPPIQFPTIISRPGLIGPTGATGATGAAGAAGALPFVQRQFTVAEMQAGTASSATGYVIVPGVSGSILVPVLFAFNERRANGFTSTPSFNLVYSDGTAIPAGVMAITMQAGANTNFWSYRYTTAPAATQQNSNNAALIGLGINFRLTVALTGGGSYTTDPIVTVGYYTLPGIIP
jgi:hypothetical protein